MGGVNPFGVGLMSLSQVVSWYLVLNQGSDQQLFDSVSKIAAFYCGWALVNRYLGGNSGELGHFSMGILAIAAYLKSRIGSLVGTGIVLVNYGVAFYFGFLLFGSAKKFAKAAKESVETIAIVWVYVFQAYVVSNLCMWSTVFYKFATLRQGWLQLPS